MSTKLLMSCPTQRSKLIRIVLPWLLVCRRGSWLPRYLSQLEVDFDKISLHNPRRVGTVFIVDLFLCVLQLGWTNSSASDCSKAPSVVSMEFLTKKFGRHLAIICENALWKWTLLELEQNILDRTISVYSRCMHQRKLLAEVAYTIIFLADRSSRYVEGEVASAVRIVDEVRKDICVKVITSEIWAANTRLTYFKT